MSQLLTTSSAWVISAWHAGIKAARAVLGWLSQEFALGFP